LTPEGVVRIRATALEAIVAHARAECPRECCGLLIGAGDLIIEAVATANSAADPVRRFEIPPVEHIRQIQRCRTLTAESGERHDVMGAYHSHPRSAAEPSPTDIEQAFQDFVYVIAGPADADEVVTNAYRLTSDGMTPVTMEVC
jgi:proteasome lid subunit RPN8/RPN11